MAGTRKQAARVRMPTPWRGLSAKLLVLTMLFVMLAEIFIFLPSIARYRLDYLRGRLASAHLATLTLEATPDNMVGPELQRQLLDHARARMIVRRMQGQEKRVLMRGPVQPNLILVDLRKATFFGLIWDAWGTILSTGNRQLRVVGPSPEDPKAMMEVVLDERPIRRDMLAYSWRILGLSVVISLFTAALVYLALHLFIVRPLRRVSENMVGFAEDPRDLSRHIQATDRRDEIGLVQNELRTMQEGLRASLRQRERLAALGEAVTKINHDLRNMLASAQLVSDRLADSDDPQVKKVAPTLFRAIDRAVTLCQQTLTYAQPKRAAMVRAPHLLAGLVDDGARSMPIGDATPALDNAVPPDLSVSVDREQFLRVFENLFGNAQQAGARHIKVTAQATEAGVRIDVEDDGPGIPEALRARLFEPFKASGREAARPAGGTGGTGLGLSIVHDIVTAHGGRIELAPETAGRAAGARFVIELPMA